MVDLFLMFLVLGTAKVEITQFFIVKVSKGVFLHVVVRGIDAFLGFHIFTSIVDAVDLFDEVGESLL